MRENNDIVIETAVAIKIDSKVDIGRNGFISTQLI